MTEGQIVAARAEIARLESLKAAVLRAEAIQRGGTFTSPEPVDPSAKYSFQIRRYRSPANEDRWLVWTENPAGEVVSSITDRLELAEALVTHCAKAI